jgi:hypothetical protein
MDAPGFHLDVRPDQGWHSIECPLPRLSAFYGKDRDSAIIDVFSTGGLDALLFVLHADFAAQNTLNALAGTGLVSPHG